MKTKQKIPVTVEFVDSIQPDGLRNDVLYIRKNKMYLSHLCLCECKRFVNIPLKSINDNGTIYTSNNNGWDLTITDGKVTVSPSILNHPCKCHYIITKGIANIV